MKHYLYLSAFLLAGVFLGGCSEDEIVKEDEGIEVPADGARLQLSFRHGTATRAIGESFAATTEEKKINKLSFYVYPAKEADQEFVPFQRYVFDMTDVTVAAPLEKDSVTITQTADGEYTCDFILREGAGFDCRVVAIANASDAFDETNNQNTYAKLQEALFDASVMPSTPSANPKDDGNYGLMMYAENHGMIRKSTTTGMSFQMQRLAARIDITNRAFNKEKPEEGFVLEAARVINAKRQSYVIPAIDEPWTAPCLTTDYTWIDNSGEKKILVFAQTGTPGADGIDQIDDQMTAGTIEQRLWHELYTSENDDNNTATSTTIEIKGKFRNAPFTRVIPFVNKDKTPVMIERNHRYLVLISPAPDQMDVTFNIQVADWDAVDTINVKPTQKVVPELADITCNGTGGSYTADNKTIEYPATSTDASFTFSAVCPFDTDTKVVYPEGYEGGEWIEVQQGEATSTKAATGFKRTYTVTLTGQEAVTAAERSALLLIRNAANATARDTLYIKQTVTAAP